MLAVDPGVGDCSMLTVTHISMTSDKLDDNSRKKEYKIYTIDNKIKKSLAS